MRVSQISFIAMASVALVTLAAGPRAASVASAAGEAEASQTGVLPRGDIEHGRYLAEHVAMCVECHSGRDEQGNIIESRKYRGGVIPFKPPWPNDWVIVVPRNQGLPGYDDEQALRLLTEGAIGRDGVPLHQPMPRFRMSRQDAADVIAFLRSAP